MTPNKQSRINKTNRPEAPMRDSTSQKEKVFDHKSTGAQQGRVRGNAPETDNQVVPGRDDEARAKKLI